MMAPTSLSPAALSERFAVASFGEEGVLFDLATGWFGLLNARATRAWENMLDCGLAHDGCRRAGQAEIADEDVRSVLGAVRNDVVEGRPDGLFHYVQDDAGYVLRVGGAPVVRIDARGGFIELCPEADRSEPAIARWLDAVAPKLLSLQGLQALHASAARIGSRVLAFSGVSGAGKTTTARAFASTPEDLLSIDVLIVRTHTPVRGGGDRTAPNAQNDSRDRTVPKAQNNTKSMVCVGAERAKNAWIRQATLQMVEDPRARVSLEPLGALATEERLPLDELWFIDATRRTGTECVLRTMSPVEAFLAIITNSFLGTADPNAWRALVQSTQQLATQVRCYTATMPRGLDALAAAARSALDSPAH